MTDIKQRLEEEEKKVNKDRQLQYGSAIEGHTNLGLAWTGIIQNHYGIELDHPLPPDLVLLMMVASKVNRAAIGRKDKIDDFVDMREYAKHALVAREEMP